MASILPLYENERFCEKKVFAYHDVITKSLNLKFSKTSGLG